MGNLLQDLRYGLRSLAKNPGFTAIAILTLALGIGANTAIFSVVESLLLRSLPYSHSEQLVEISNTYPPQVPRGGLSPGDYADWRKQNASFSEMGAYAINSVGMNLSGEGAPQRIQAGYADAGLFPMLGIRAVAGRGFVPEEDRAGSAPVVMLGHRLWQSRFGGDASVIGRSITLDNRRYTVVGILPAGMQLLRSADLWMPFGQFDDDLTEHVHHEFVAIARLKPGTNLAQARDEVGRLHEQEATAYPDAHKNFGVVVEPLQDSSAARLRPTLLVLFGAVGLVLLIACSNIVNLLLVRNAAREREVALRSALGASPWRLIRQMLTESMLLSVFGAALGLLFAYVGLKVLLDLCSRGAFGAAGSGIEWASTGFYGGCLLHRGTGVWIFSGVAAVAIQSGRGFETRESKATSGSGAAADARPAGGFGNRHGAGAADWRGIIAAKFSTFAGNRSGIPAGPCAGDGGPAAALSIAESNSFRGRGQATYGLKKSLRFEQIAAQIRALPGVEGRRGNRAIAAVRDDCAKLRDS